MNSRKQREESVYADAHAVLQHWQATSQLLKLQGREHLNLAREEIKLSIKAVWILVLTLMSISALLAGTWLIACGVLIYSLIEAGFSSLFSAGIFLLAQMIIIAWLSINARKIVKLIGLSKTTHHLKKSFFNGEAP